MICSLLAIAHSLSYILIADMYVHSNGNHEKSLNSERPQLLKDIGNCDEVFAALVVK
jgi:hypothetical protein